MTARTLALLRAASLFGLGYATAEANLVSALASIASLVVSFYCLTDEELAARDRHPSTSDRGIR
jgi:hypothetical protein